MVRKRSKLALSKLGFLKKIYLPAPLHLSNINISDVGFLFLNAMLANCWLVASEVGCVTGSLQISPTHIEKVKLFPNVQLFISQKVNTPQIVTKIRKKKCLIETTQ